MLFAGLANKFEILSGFGKKPSGTSIARGMKLYQDTPIKLVGRLRVIEDDVDSDVIAIIHPPEFHTQLKIWYCRIHIPALLANEEIVMAEDYARATELAVKFLESLGDGEVDVWRVPVSNVH